MTTLIATVLLLSAVPCDYASARGEAIANGGPVVVGVGCAPPESPEWHTAMVKCPWHEYRTPCIVVSLPRKGELYYHATLPPTATAAQVRNAIWDNRTPVRVPTDPTARNEHFSGRFQMIRTVPR